MRSMVTGYLRSKEGEKEYGKLGIPYPDTIQDTQYIDWLNNTTTEGMSEYTRHKPIEIRKITRVKLADGSANRG